MRRLCLFLVFFAACGDSSVSVSEQALAGTFGGEAWTAKSAIAFAESEGFSVRVSPTELECSFALPDAKILLFTAPKAAGVYELGLTQGHTVTFVTPPADNAIALEGVISVEAVVDEGFKVGVNAKMGETNSVDGKIDVRLCPGI